MNNKGAKLYIFLSTYIGVTARHIGVLGWSMCKAKVFKDLGFSKPEMGAMDFTYLVFYATGNIVGGQLNGIYSSKLITSLSFIMLGILYSFTIWFS